MSYMKNKTFIESEIINAPHFKELGEEGRPFSQPSSRDGSKFYVSRINISFRLDNSRCS